MSLRILKYFISIYFIISSVLCFGQSDTLRKIGARFGYDLSNIALNYFHKELHEEELMTDFGISRRLFLAGEIGFATTNLSQDILKNYSFTSSGQFIRIGIDYDMLNKYSNDIITFGVRYGRCRLVQSVPDYTIIDEYWGSYNSSISEEKLNANWFSLNISLKVELLTNLFFGYTIQGNILVSSFKDVNISPYYIPGYGKIKERNSVSMNYGIYYLIPIRKL